MADDKGRISAIEAWAHDASPADIADRIADLERTLEHIADADAEDVSAYWRDEAASAVERSQKHDDGEQELPLPDSLIGRRP
jgi:hypothetical protein